MKTCKVCFAKDNEPCKYREDWSENGIKAGDLAPWTHTFGERE